MEENKKVFRVGDQGKSPRAFARIKEGKKIGDICTGIAEYTNSDIGLIRVGFILGLLCVPHFVLLYLLTMLVIPYKD